MLAKLNQVDPNVLHGDRRIAALSLVAADSSPSRLEPGMKPPVMEYTTHQGELVVRDQISLSEPQYRELMNGGENAGNMLSGIADGVSKAFDMATNNGRSINDPFKDVAVTKAHLGRILLEMSSSRRSEYEHDVRADPNLAGLVNEVVESLTPVHVVVDDPIAVRNVAKSRIQLLGHQRSSGGLLPVLDISLEVATAISAAVQRMNGIRSQPVSQTMPTLLAPAAVFKQFASLGASSRAPFGSQAMEQETIETIPLDEDLDVPFPSFLITPV